MIIQKMKADDIWAILTTAMLVCVGIWIAILLRRQAGFFRRGSRLLRIWRWFAGTVFCLAVGFMIASHFLPIQNAEFLQGGSLLVALGSGGSLYSLILLYASPNHTGLRTYARMCLVLFALSFVGLAYMLYRWFSLPRPLFP